MPLNLVKGERINLSKDNPNLKEIQVCLGWNAGDDFDLDTSAFLLKSEKLISEKDVIFYNMDRIDASGNVVDRTKYVGRPEDYTKAGKLMHISGSILHSGDDRTGAGNITHSNDKEIITVKLDKVPLDRDKIAFVVTIYEAARKNQNFGQVSNAFIRVVDASNGQEILRYNLSEDFSKSTAIIAGEVYRYNNDWKFAAVGNGLHKGLENLLILYGMSYNPV